MKSISKILQNLEKLQPYNYMLARLNMRLFYVTFLAFKDVASTAFSSGALHPLWRAQLHHLRDCINALNRVFGMSITPKLHIMIVHIEQWIDSFGRPLGMEGEQGGEAVHHLWRRLLETLGEPKSKESPAYVIFVMKALLIFNSNSV